MRISLNKYLLFCVLAVVFTAQNSLASTFEEATAAVMVLKASAHSWRESAEKIRSYKERSYKEVLLDSAEVSFASYDKRIMPYGYIKIIFEDGVVAELTKQKGLRNWHYSQKRRTPIGEKTSIDEKSSVLSVGLEDFDWDNFMVL